MQNWAPRPFKCPFPCKRLTISTASRLSVRDEPRRRIVDDLVKHRDFWWVIERGAVYAGTVLIQGGTLSVLNIYRSWVGERATGDLRHRVHVLKGAVNRRTFDTSALASSRGSAAEGAGPSRRSHLRRLRM
jgi:hypothetical protein